MVPRDASVSPPWEPPPKCNSIQQKDKMSWTPKGSFRHLAHPIVIKQRGTTGQTRHIYTPYHTISQARNATSQTPAEHRNTQRVVTRGSHAEAVGHLPPSITKLHANGPKTAITDHNRFPFAGGKPSFQPRKHLETKTFETRFDAFHKCFNRCPVHCSGVFV